VVGGEFRAWREQLTSGNMFHFAQPRRTLYLGNAFVQDEVTLRDGLKLTLGLKAEDNSYSGLDWLPNVRLAWKLAPDQLLWGAISRSVRTPSRIDRELEALPFLAPAPDFQPETVIAYELGYRAQPLSNLSLSISAYYNVYNDLRSADLTAGGLPFMLVNGLRADTYGVEVWGDYTPTRWWRLSAGLSNLHVRVAQKPGHFDITQFQSVGEDPAYQAFLRSRINVSPAVTFDADLRAIDHIDHPLFGAVVPAYAEANARLGWRMTDDIELSVAALNLLHDRHMEANDPSTLAPREIGRTAYVSLRWGF
jgi:iron complex outermembrane receptor protein